MVTKTIDTLVGDLKDTLLNGVSLSDDDWSVVGQKFASLMKARLGRGERSAGLRMSNIGSECERELWYKTNKPDAGEPLEAETYLKFLYGDLIEFLFVELLIPASGHAVRGTQDELSIEGVKGHCDLICDEVVLDLKSASPYGFKKFQDHKLEHDDPFAYLPQITSYVHASDARDKSRGGFLAIEKVSGKMVLDLYKINSVGIEAAYRERIAMVAKPTPPERSIKPVAEGAKGNKKLDVKCGYCAFKKTCWPGLRGFAYAKGPVYLTEVSDVPKVPEFKVPKYG